MRSTSNFHASKLSILATNASGDSGFYLSRLGTILAFHILPFNGEFSLEKDELETMLNRNRQKGVTSVNFLLLGVLIIFGAVFAFKYFQERSNDITIHLPRIESH
jgi:hypothetical protein